MPACYTGSGTGHVGAGITLMGLHTLGRARAAVYDIVLGSHDQPAHVATMFVVGRFTAPGASCRRVVPQPLDPDSPPAAAEYRLDYTTPPRYVRTSLLEVSRYQRITYRWVAEPGAEMVAPATVGGGIGIYSRSSSGSPAYDVVVFHREE